MTVTLDELGLRGVDASDLLEELEAITKRQGEIKLLLKICRAASKKDKGALLTTKEAARKAGVSWAKVKKDVALGKIMPDATNGVRRLFYESTVQHYKREHCDG